MSHLPRRQTPALATTRGALRIYRQCEPCRGTGWMLGREDLHADCPQCAGTGNGILVDEISKTRATNHARAVRNHALEQHGRQPYD